MPFRDIRVGNLRDRSADQSFVKIGTATLPFTLEERHYAYAGNFGIEWWSGPKEVREDLFVAS